MPAAPRAGPIDREPRAYGRALALSVPVRELPGKLIDFFVVDEVRGLNGHAFISYVREDSGRVGELQQALELAGVPVWRDTTELRPGEYWRAEIRRAITDGSLVFIACFSQRSFARETTYQREELAQAIDQARMRRPGEPWLIPVRLDDCDIPDYDIGGGRRLADVQHVDLFGERSADSTARLVAAVVQLLNRSARDGRRGGSAAATNLAQEAPRPPGVLPLVYNAPPAVAAFTGRDALLAQLREALRADPRPVVVQAVHGLGGVGKTALVLQHLHATANLYRLIWWIDAQQPIRIGEQLAALGSRAGWVPAGVQLATAIDLTRQRLRTTPGWLLVFDNAASPDDIYASLPQGPGHVLITSRDRAWEQVSTVTPISVDVFARTESVALLRRLVPVLAQADADRIAEAVGHLPLALAQAGGVLATTAPEVYLAQLRDRVSAILSQGSPPTYPTSLAAVVRLASEHLADQDPAAAQLIMICAHLAPEPIPIAWFSAAPAGVLPEPLATATGDPILAGACLRDVASHGLGTVDAAGTLQLHRLTSAIIVDVLSEDQRDLSRGQAESVLVAAQPRGAANDPATWPYWVQLLPHLLIGKAAETDNADWWKLASHAVAYLVSRGDYAAARPVAGAVYQYRLSRLGPDHSDTLSAASDVALVLLQLGRHREALIVGEDTLARRRQVHGADDPGTLRTAGNLASTLRVLGRLDEAAALDADTLTRKRQVLGRHHPETLMSASSLAATLIGLRRFARALALNKDVLAHRKDTLGEDHPYSLSSASYVAATFVLMGRYDDSFAVNEDTLARRRRVLGADHPDTLISASNVATDLRLRGQAAKALTLDEDTLARRRQVLGEDHPATLASINGLAADLASLKRFAEALACYEDVLRRRRRVQGEDHPDTLLTANFLSVIYRRTWRLARLWRLAWRTAWLLARRQRRHLSWSWNGHRAAFSGAVEVDRSVSGPIRLRRIAVFALTSVLSPFLYASHGLVLVTGRRFLAAIAALDGLLLLIACDGSLAQDDIGSAVTTGVLGLAGLAIGFVLERNNFRRWLTARRARHATRPRT
jgi:tetratricopeptide (TPR) repeat protein